MDSVTKEISELNTELDKLRKNHSNYIADINKVKNAQKKCADELQHQKHRVKQISKTLKNLKNPSNKSEVVKLLDDLNSRNLCLREIQETLPRQNSMYLKIVIGHVNVSLLSKQEKFAYKEDYERFKLMVTTVSFVFNLLLYSFIRNRILDAAFHFLLVWYYCTLTIREQILVMNGSRIKGWWLASHFIYTVLNAIMLIWPSSESYDMFRDQFMSYSLYMSFVQFIQYYYQKGCLYKLRTLGERHNMDITVDGFMSWMFKHLTFILPLLFSVYFYQLYNAWTLCEINTVTMGKEWQVLVVAGIYLFLAFGNILTALVLIHQKLQGRTAFAREFLQQKYRFLVEKDN